MAAFAAQAGPLFMGLGDLPGGDVYSEAAIVWANGSVVFGTSEIIDDDEEAFRWTNAGGIVGLGLLPGGSFDYSYANTASADGSVAVGYSGHGPGQFSAGNNVFSTSLVGARTTINRFKTSANSPAVDSAIFDPQDLPACHNPSGQLRVRDARPIDAARFAGSGMLRQSAKGQIVLYHSTWLRR